MRKSVRCLLIVCIAAMLLVSAAYAEGHVHGYGEWNISSEATCGKDGLKVRICAECGNVDKQTIQATGNHSYGEWNVSSDATCNKDGLKVRICSACGNVDKQTIQATGNHSYGEWNVSSEATCNKDGLKVRICSACGDVEKQTIQATGVHSYGEWNVSTKATCDTDGLKVRICSACGNVDKETIKSPGHQYGEWQTKATASCTDDGEEVRICSECGKVDTKTIAAKHNYTSKKVAPTTHSRGYTEHTCTVCGYTYRNQWKARLTEEETTDTGKADDQTQGDSTDETVSPDAASSSAAEAQNGIVTDADDLAVAYQATRVVSIMKVVASAETNGSDEVRKLHLSIALLTQWKKEGVKTVRFIVGEVAVQFDLEVFDSEDIALIANDMAQNMTGYVIELNPKADGTDTAALLRVWLDTEDGADTDITEFIDDMELTVSGSPVDVQ